MQLPFAHWLGHVDQGCTVIRAGVSDGNVGLSWRWGKTLMKLVGGSQRLNFTANVAGLSFSYFTYLCIPRAWHGGMPSKQWR